MLFLQKLWSFIKHYWSAIVIAIAAALIYYFNKKNYDSLLKVLDDSNKRHEQELQDLEALHQKDIAQRDANIKLYQQQMDAIEKAYEEQKKELDDAKRAEIQQILTDTKDNPDALAQKLSAAAGFTIVLPN